MPYFSSTPAKGHNKKSHPEPEAKYLKWKVFPGMRGNPTK